MTISRRHFLGFGSLLLASCGIPTHAIADDDDMPRPRPQRDPNRDRRCGAATADNIEGPFYKEGAPNRSVLVASADRGTRLAIAGIVMSTACEPLAKAEVDVWHADATGAYDNDGYKFRGTMLTDDKGRYDLRTIIPGRYLNGSTYRPAHIHVKVRASKHEELTTQLYFDGDPYNDKDAFIDKSLIMKHQANKQGIRIARFDFVLA
jgi:protocatechuate 3,4-dioxygenase beta subunit